MSPQPEKPARRRGKARTVMGIDFATRRELEAYIRAILRRAVPLEPLEPGDEAFMREILQTHPNYREKVGAGIRYLYVYEIPGTGGQRRFEILRTDGTKRDFRWLKCLDPPNAFRDLERLLRRLALGQKLRFRDARYESGEGWRCELCGNLLLYSRETAVDHRPPWELKRLVEDWLELVGRTAGQVRIVPDPGYMRHSRLAEPDLAARWLDFHQLNAKLRLLCQPCHVRVHGRRAEPLD